MIKKLLLIFTIITILISCDEDRNPHLNNNLKNIDSLDSANSIANCDTLETMKFQKHIIADANDLQSIKSEFGYSNNAPFKNKLIITLNRKDFRFFRIGDTIVIPEKITDNMLDYSIFPKCYPEANEIPKLIVLSNKYQCYACYENGKLVRFAAANTGKERTQTYPGKYYTNWKKKNHRSSLDSNWRLPFNVNFHLQAGNAFHQFTMPGRPVSHSCVRQFMSDAEWLYNWAEKARFDTNRRVTQKGTLVIIIDVFDFNRKSFGPWLDLADNKSANIVLPKDPANYEDPFIPLIQIPAGSRGSLQNINRYKYAKDSLVARGYLRADVNPTPSVNFNHLRKKKREAAAKAAAEKEKANQNTQIEEQQ